MERSADNNKIQYFIGEQLYADYAKSVLYIISYPESDMGLPWLGPKNIFKIKVLRQLESAILRQTFANTVNDSFNYSFIRHMYKHYVAFNSSNIT